METSARRLGRDVRFTGWLGRDEALTWLAHASVLVFPSYGPESLSRVLLESAALGVPMAAMNTGGTIDIVRHEQTGLLSSSPDELGDHVARLVGDRGLAARLADHARAHVERHFEAASVVARIEALYAALANRGAAHA
jgi:glycosyltransferase involved in cell wall biosynthesis